MQNSSIELKSSQFALTLVMDPSVSFDQILADVRDKFRSSARFFRGAQMALEFRGRDLTQEQQSEVASVITRSCGLDIICILEKDESSEQAQYRAITQVLKESPPEPEAQDPDPAKHALPGSQDADVFRGTVKNGQKVFSDRSVLVLGDV